MKMRYGVAKSLGFAAAVALLAAAGTAMAEEPVFVVKVADMKRSGEYRVLTQAELKALDKDLQAEAKAFQTALNLAAKDWRNDEVYKALPFPGSRLSARKIVGQPERFTKQEEADKKLAFYKDADAKRTAREAQKLKDLEKKDKKAYDAQIKKEKDQQEKDIPVDKALEMLQTHLDELTGKPPEMPTVPGQKPDEKKPAADKEKAKEGAGKALDKGL